MKEATGELNMTIIVALAVATLAAFFYAIIWPMIKESNESNAKCAKAICKCDNRNGNNCEDTGYANCHLKGNRNSTFRCPWKG